MRELTRTMHVTLGGDLLDLNVYRFRPLLDVLTLDHHLVQSSAWHGRLCRSIFQRRWILLFRLFDLFLLDLLLGSFFGIFF